MNRSYLTVRNIFIIIVAVFTLCQAKSVTAAGEAGPVQKYGPAVSVSTTPIYQFETPLHNGSISLFRQHTNFRLTGAISKETEVGLNLSHDFADYRFTGNTTLAGGAKPWGAIHTLNLGGSLQRELAPTWKILITPSISVSREDDARWDNAISYGGYAALTHDFTSDLSLGMGVGAFNNLDKISFIAGLAIKWRITDRLMLANPFRPGVTGPAGLELSYRMDNGWNIGGGMAYRHNRFRLNSNSNSYTSNGIGDVTSIPAWLRLSHNLGKNLNFDLYSGVVLGGKLQIDDSNGSRLSSDHHQPAPFMAVTISARF